ncbi:dockerin type I domain-containing protein [Planctomycetaceae bacterium SH139]
METELIYQLNRHRVTSPKTINSGASDIKTTTGTQPLAINRELAQAASEYANSMAELNFFSHIHPETGVTANLRVRQAVYELASWLGDDANNVELIAGGNSLVDPAAALAELLDSNDNSNQSRRDALLGVDEVFAAHQEIGVGFGSRPASAFENYWVIALGHRAAADRFMTGVVYDDVNFNGQFDAGEGIAGVEVKSGALITRSDSTGAYTLRVGSGVHYLVTSGVGLSSPIEQAVIVREDNVQVDFIAGGDAQVNFRSRSLWTAPYRHVDVNQNGTVEPLDALAVINHLNRHGAGRLEWTNQQPIISHIDTNGDQFASPLDALLVINYLNRRVGEGEANVSAPAPVFWLAGLWDGTEEKTSPAAEEGFDPSLDTLTSPSRFSTTYDSA